MNPFRAERSMTGLQHPPPPPTSPSLPGTDDCNIQDPTGSWAPLLPSKASWRPSPGGLTPEPTPECRMTAPEEPATQVGDSKKVCGIHPVGLQLSKLWRRIIPRHTSADWACLPPEAVREARNLQNFFPFPWQEEEEEALEDDDIEEEEQNDDPADDPVGFLDCCCWERCCWWGVAEKWAFFLREARLSLKTAFLMASLCSTFNDFSTAFLRTSERKTPIPKRSWRYGCSQRIQKILSPLP